jgi:hypothetical protein
MFLHGTASGGDSRHPGMLLTIICTRGFISVPLEIGGQDLSFVSTATISGESLPFKYSGEAGLSHGVLGPGTSYVTGVWTGGAVRVQSVRRRTLTSISV